MSYLSFILLGAVSFILAPSASAMECSVVGVSMSCPTLIDDQDKVFCCDSRVQGVQYCCDIEDFMKTHSGIIAGIVIGLVVIVIIITLCCCCFCSCCCLARRRVQRGHVLYGRVDGAQVVTAPPPTYQVVHPPPATQACSLPPYNYAASSQPPLNPYYK